MNTPTPRERFRKTLHISTGVSELLADSNASYIHWLEKELTAVTEQRDRLAGGLKWIAGWNHQLFDENTAMQMRDKAEQALQSLTQPTP